MIITLLFCVDVKWQISQQPMESTMAKEMVTAMAMATATARATITKKGLPLHVVAMCSAFGGATPCLHPHGHKWKCMRHGGDTAKRLVPILAGAICNKFRLFANAFLAVTPHFLIYCHFFLSLSRHFWCPFPYFLRESFVCLKVSFLTEIQIKVSFLTKIQIKLIR